MSVPLSRRGGVTKDPWHSAPGERAIVTGFGIYHWHRPVEPHLPIADTLPVHGREYHRHTEEAT